MVYIMKKSVMIKPLLFGRAPYCSPKMEVFDEEAQGILCVSSEDVDWNEGEFAF